MLIFIIVTLGALLFGILHSNLKIRFSITKHDKDDSVVVSLTSFYGIFNHTRRISATDLIKRNKTVPTLDVGIGITDKENKPVDHGNSPRNIFDTEKIIDEYREIYARYEHYIREKLVFDNIYWYTKVGTNDAAQTAILVGVIWAIKTSVISFIARGYNFPDVSMNVVPDYNVNIFETSINGIFSIKLGYIINANIKAILAQIKGWCEK